MRRTALAFSLLALLLAGCPGPQGGGGGGGGGGGDNTGGGGTGGEGGGGGGGGGGAAASLNVSTASVTVPEGGTATFTVALSADPGGAVTVSVAKTAGDPDITVQSGASLSFDSSNFSTAQTVTVAAAEDVDSVNGTATLTVSAQGLTSVDVTATEADNDLGPKLSAAYRGVPQNVQQFGFSGPTTSFGCPGPSGSLSFDLANSGLSSDSHVSSVEFAPDVTNVVPVLRPLGGAKDAITNIELQNVGAVFSYYAIIYLDANGVPVGNDCTGTIAPGAFWEFSDARIPAGAASGIIYSFRSAIKTLSPPVDPCALVANVSTASAFLQFDALHRPNFVVNSSNLNGSPATAVVRRSPTNQNTSGEGRISAAYNGFSSFMIHATASTGLAPGQYAIPAVVVRPDGQDTTIHVFNDNGTAASVTVTFINPDNGTQTPLTQGVAPFGSLTVAASAVMGTSFTGSAIVTGDKPLAVVVDLTGPAPTATSFAATRAEAVIGGGSILSSPLIYEPGWQQQVFAQNLSAGSSEQITVEFRDSVGSLLFRNTETVRPQRSLAFTLPADKAPATLTPGVVTVTAANGTAAATLLATQTTAGLTAPQQSWAADLSGPGTTFDPNASNRGAKVLALPLFGRAAGSEGLNSEVLVFNANPNPGLTSFVLYVYGSAGVYEFMCGNLGANQTQRVSLDFNIVGQGFQGAMVLAAAQSNQPGGPGLSAIVLERPQPVTPLNVPPRPAPSGKDGGAAMTAALVSTGGQTGLQSGKELFLPVLRDSPGEAATPTIDIQNVGLVDGRVGIVFFSSNGVPLVPVVGPQALATGNTLTLDTAIPADAASAAVFSFDLTNTDAANTFQAVVDSTSYTVFLARHLGGLFTGSFSPPPLAGSVGRLAASGRLADCPAMGGPLLGVDDPVNGGFEYTTTVYAASGTLDSTLFLQNAGVDPVSVELSLRRPGLAAAAVSGFSFDTEGGDLSARIPFIPPGARVPVRVADLFGGGFAGRLTLRSEAPLAVAVDTSGSLTSDHAWPIALNYVFNGTPFFTLGTGVVYAPFLPDPAQGWTASLEIMNLEDLGLARSGNVSVEYLDSSGVLRGSQTVQVRAFESSIITPPAGLPFSGEPGWMRISAQGSPLQLAGLLRVTNASVSPPEEIEYALSPQFSPVGTNSIEQTISGVSKHFGASDISSQIVLVNTESNAAAAPVTVQMLFTGASGPVNNTAVTLAPGQLKTVDAASISGIPSGFHGSVIIFYTPNTANDLPIVAVAHHRAASP